MNSVRLGVRGLMSLEPLEPLARDSLSIAYRDWYAID